MPDQEGYRAFLLLSLGVFGALETVFGAFGLM